jgi:hypothetical protein
MELQISDEMNTYAQLSPLTARSVPEIISPRKPMLAVMKRDDLRLDAISSEFKELKMVDCYPMAGRPRMDRLKYGGKADLTCLKTQSGKLRTLQSGDRQHARWLHHVRRLKNHQKSFQEKLQGVKIVPNQSAATKPFGKFLNCKPSTANRSVTPLRSITPMRPRMDRGGSDDFLSPYKTLSRRVTFRLPLLPGGGGANDDPVAAGVSMHTTSTRNSTVFSDYSGDVKALTSSLSSHKNHSLHRCVPVKTKILHKRKLERLFWSESDIQKSLTKSMRRAKAFQSEHPATVQQLSRIFMDTCSQSKSRTEDHWNEDEEEQEEMLRHFLRDWAASNVRGLEDMVTGRDLFKETRTMAVQSVLAYQQTLRDTMCATTVDRMADLLRARSESTSHRARMFAMYLALGDAIVASSDEECHFLHDDRSINVV